MKVASLLNSGADIHVHVSIHVNSTCGIGRARNGAD